MILSRAISGCPVYVSDKPDSHNFDIIKRLSDSNGEVFLPLEIAKPTISCLFKNPFKEDVLFKLFNYNKFGGVIGVFNLKYTEKNSTVIMDSVKPSDIEGFDVGDYAVYEFFGEKSYCISANEKVDVMLPQLKAEIYTITKIENGFAPIGLVNKYNSAGAILDIRHGFDNNVCVTLKDGGKFAAYCDEKPLEVKLNGESVSFEYENNLLETQIHSKGITNIEILVFKCK